MEARIGLQVMLFFSHLQVDPMAASQVLAVYIRV